MTLSEGHREGLIRTLLGGDNFLEREVTHTEGSMGSETLRPSLDPLEESVVH